MPWPKRRQALAFLGSGVASTVVYFGLIALTYDGFGWSRYVALSVAYVCAVSFHFAMNRRVTFAATQGHVGRQVQRYLAMVVLNYGITMLVVFTLEKLLGLNLYLATAASIVATMVSGFVLMKRWVFA